MAFRDHKSVCRDLLHMALQAQKTVSARHHIAEPLGWKNFEYSPDLSDRIGARLKTSQKEGGLYHEYFPLDFFIGERDATNWRHLLAHLPNRHTPIPPGDWAKTGIRDEYCVRENARNFEWQVGWEMIPVGPEFHLLPVVELDYGNPLLRAVLTLNLEPTVSVFEPKKFLCPRRNPELVLRGTRPLRFTFRDRPALGKCLTLGQVKKAVSDSCRGPLSSELVRVPPPPGESIPEIVNQVRLILSGPVSDLPSSKS